MPSLEGIIHSNYVFEQNLTCTKAPRFSGLAMFGMDVDARDILEGLKGRDTEGGSEGWSYQKQKDSLEAFNMDILICDNVVYT